MSARRDQDQAFGRAKNNWIEFWYQPKIDLRRKKLAGAEAFAHARHPLHGVLPPASFMPGADDASLLALAEQALVSALKFGLQLVASWPSACTSPSTSRSTRWSSCRSATSSAHHRPQPTTGRASSSMSPRSRSSTRSARRRAEQELAGHNVKLAIDDFGRAYATLKGARSCRSPR